MNPKTLSRKGGFSLIELLVVISIIGILMGIVIPSAIGILSTSDKTKMSAIFRSWVTQLNQYKSHYGYYPPFLYEELEGEPTYLKKSDNLESFIFALKGKVKTENGWIKTSDEDLIKQNKQGVEFHSFGEDEFDQTGKLIANKSIAILVDHDGDGVISLEVNFLEKIIESLKQEYGSSSVGENIENNREQMKLIHQGVAIVLLNDEDSDLQNVYSWGLEKYFED